MTTLPPLARRLSLLLDHATQVADAARASGMDRLADQLDDIRRQIAELAIRHSPRREREAVS